MSNSATGAIQERWLPSSQARWDDRRTTRRFPLELDLSYSLPLPSGLATGAGQTVNLSSGGALFQTAAPIAEGSEIHLSIVWPVALDDGVPLRLFVIGMVRRSDPGYTAVKFLVYQFRTAHRGKDANDVSRWYWGRRLCGKPAHKGIKGAA